MVTGAAIADISIHALAKRATTPPKNFPAWQLISIHALAKRATSTCILVCTLYLHFNPRPRKEGDYMLCSLISAVSIFQSTPSQRGRLLTAGEVPEEINISIHALAKRATYDDFLTCYGVSHFNPRPRKEGDTQNLSVRFLKNDFNPRPRKEGDMAVNMVVTIFSIFQSTPSQRGRLKPGQKKSRLSIFQSTPSQRGRLAVNMVVTIFSNFNPRPRKEGDICCAAL